MKDNIYYEIIDENEDFIVVNKYPNISFHSENNEIGLFQRLSDDLKCRLYAVHRLDKITSGIIIAAKSKEAASALSELFSSGKVCKYYVAFSDKKPKKKKGLISGDMNKSRNGQWKLTRAYNNPAVTRFSSLKYNDKYLFLLNPKTGKTHQIRVAMKSLSSPILGDTLYHGTPSDRGYLHSFKLAFFYKGKNYEYEKYPNIGIFFCDKQIYERISEMASLFNRSYLKKKERY